MMPSSTELALTKFQMPMGVPLKRNSSRPPLKVRVEMVSGSCVISNDKKVEEFSYLLVLVDK